MVKIFKNLLIHFPKQIHFTLLKSQYCLWITWKAPLKLIKNVCKLIYRLEELNEFLNHYRCWLFYHSQKFFFFLLHESQDNFFCCKNIFIIVKTFFFLCCGNFFVPEKVFLLLWEYFYCRENCSFCSENLLLKILPSIKRTFLSKAKVFVKLCKNSLVGYLAFA